MSDTTTNNNQRLLNRTGAALAFCMVVIFGGGIYLLATRDVPQANHDILLVLITAVASIVGQFMSYFFGSSAGAKAKDDALNTAITTAGAIQAALPTPPIDKVIPIKANETVAIHSTDASAKPTEPTP